LEEANYMKSEDETTDGAEVRVYGSIEDLTILQEALKSAANVVDVGEVTLRSETTEAARQPFAIADLVFTVSAHGLAHLTAIAAWETYIKPSIDSKRARRITVSKPSPSDRPSEKSELPPTG
jgi:hypothetical protein